MIARNDSNSGLPLRAVLDDAEIVGAADVVVTHCTTDAQLCREGDVYVAFDDEDGHGHEAAAEAVRLGASAVVASRPITVAVPVCYVPDSRLAYGRICQALAGSPSSQIKTIGVGGSLGKTTTAYLIASILSQAGKTPGVLGSLGYCDGAEAADARWTTPPPPVTAAWLKRMVANGCTHAVFEASVRGIERGHTAGIDFDVCCLTNLHRESTPGSATIDVRRATSKFLDGLSPEGMLIANVDNPGVSEIAARHEGPLITVGVHAAAELSASIVERHASEQTFLLSFGRETVPVRSRLVGLQNVENCLVAAAAGTVYGIAPDVIVRGIESVTELPGRLEQIVCGQPFNVFLDDAPSPTALATCLENLRKVAARRLICVFDGSAVAAGSFGEWQRTINEWCDEAIVIDESSRLRSAQFGTRRRAERVDAVTRTLRTARSGDCVLIAGGVGPDDEREREYADDRQIVRQTLYRLQHEDVPRSHSA